LRATARAHPGTSALLALSRPRAVRMATPRTTECVILGTTAQRGLKTRTADPALVLRCALLDATGWRAVPRPQRLRLTARLERSAVLVRARRPAMVHGQPVTIACSGRRATTARRGAAQRRALLDHLVRVAPRLLPAPPVSRVCTTLGRGAAALHALLDHLVRVAHRLLPAPPAWRACTTLGRGARLNAALHALRGRIVRGGRHRRAVIFAFRDRTVLAAQRLSRALACARPVSGAIGGPFARTARPMLELAPRLQSLARPGITTARRVAPRLRAVRADFVRVVCVAVRDEVCVRPVG
jgi:hypothetical protein